MDRFAKIQPSGLPLGVETEQPLLAQKYKPQTITIENAPDKVKNYKQNVDP